MAYWFTLDADLAIGDTRPISLTFSTAPGVPVSIAAWTFYYKAVKVDDSAVSLTVADAAMTKTDSGLGVTDTVTIILDNSATASLTAGRYRQEVAVKIATEPTVIAKGTLNVVARETVVA
jgi:hypothetical protein